MIRLFTGIELPPDISEQVYTLHGGVPNARWVDRDKLHMTLRFLGEVQEDVLENIHNRFVDLHFPAFDMALTQLGYFATADVPHHLWIGVSYYQALDDLTAKIDRIARDCGINNDRFKFHAHVTLASLHGTTLMEVMNFISNNNLFRTRDFKVYYFTLFSSHARENGSGKYYRVEARYPLVLG